MGLPTVVMQIAINAMDIYKIRALNVMRNKF